MLKIKFKVEECEDNIYESESEGEEEEKTAEKPPETLPVILSCVGWNTKNMARAAL